MRLKFILCFLSVILLIVSCFLPWIFFDARDLSFRGVDEVRLAMNSGTKEINWGRPAYFHFVWAGIFLLALFIKKGWATWVMLIAAAFNIAWALRNFLMLTACGGGECPVRKEGLYLLLAASVVMLICLLLPERFLKSKV